MSQNRFCLSTGRFLLAAALMLFMGSAHADGGSNGGATSFDKDEVISQTRSGAINYHATYGTIINTIVVIQGYRLRTNDGSIIPVRGDRIVVDLNDLTARKRGLPLDLSKVKFPGGGPTIDVVEIEANVVDCADHKLVFEPSNRQFGSTCALKAPKTLNLYSQQQPFQLFNAPDYLIKVGFEPLNAIQLDIVQTKSQKVSCWTAFENQKPVCRPSGHPVTRTAKQCELANRRLKLADVVRAADEA
jgi:hypothetical protein